MGGKKTVAVTGIRHIHHRALPVQHHCLLLWIQIQFIQGHISPPWALSVFVDAGLFPPVMLPFLWACFSFLLAYTSVAINVKGIKKNITALLKPLNSWLMWDIYLWSIHKCFSWLKYVKSHLPVDGRLLFPPTTFNIYIFLWHQNASAGLAGRRRWPLVVRMKASSHPASIRGTVGRHSANNKVCLSPLVWRLAAASVAH